MKPDTSDPAFVGALVYFEAASSRLSFAAAAADLGVTPSAISHRIAALEQALGQKLFRRETRQVQLTPEGADLANVVSESFCALRTVAARLVDQRVLRVSVGPYLSSQWLMARLNRFEAIQPGTRVDLMHVIGPALPREADVSIVWEDVAAERADHWPLFNTASVPVAAPGRVVESRFWEDKVPPIHYRDRGPWRHWLCSAGAPLSFADSGDVFADPNLVFEAAIHGQRIALGFLPFIAEPIASGRLVAISDIEVPAQSSYRVVVIQPKNSVACAFRDWLVDEAEQTGSGTVG